MISLQEEQNNQQPQPENIVSPPVEVSSKPQTPMVPASSDLEYAGFWQRFFASLIDSILIFGVYLVAVILLAVAFWAAMPGSDTNYFGLFAGLGYFPMLILFIVYEPFMIANYGATFGKRWMQIKVIDRNSQKPTWGTAILREWVGKFASGFIPFAVGYLWMLWDPKKQTVHDKIASTFVVKAK